MTTHGINGFGNDGVRRNPLAGGIGKQENALPAQKETIDIVNAKQVNKEYGRDFLGDKDFDWGSFGLNLSSTKKTANAEFNVALAALNKKYPALQAQMDAATPVVQARVGQDAINALKAIENADV